jgi:hypothetical protein
MYDDHVRSQATRMRAAGATWSEISRSLGISRSTLRLWEATGGRRTHQSRCPRCEPVDLDPVAYAALLGYYLGDGCLSRHPRFWALRVSCDARRPGIIADVTACIDQVRTDGKVFHVDVPGAVVVTSNWQHWTCLFPQHGPGRKHTRSILLEDWQRVIVEAHPGPFLRGLFHSDGCRSDNWTQHVVAGEMKRYDYPRWLFSNVSADIRELCCWALDLAGVAWRQNNWNSISVARREAVARLDDLIGMKR